jgi:hypothetical protein
MSTGVANIILTLSSLMETRAGPIFQRFWMMDGDFSYSSDMLAGQ